MPTFLGNHDMGRFAMLVRKDRPGIGNRELLDRVALAHVMLMTLRGVPTIYAGDEQGFVGDGWDQDAREDMFPSRVASYNDNRLVGTTGDDAEGIAVEVIDPVGATLVRVAVAIAPPIS